MIEVKHLSKKFHKKVVFDDISFQLDNRIYGLLGPNGSGKTTLFRVMTNLLSINHGEISLDKNLKIGYLPQKFNALSEITVYEQMYYFSVLKKIPKNDRKNAIEEALNIVHLNQEINKKCQHLSGGMLRRLGIAQAIMGNPQLLLLDEPTVGLDLEERLHFKTILKTLEGKFPIVLSTHIVEDIEDICQEILVLHKGKLIFNGSRQECLEIVKNKVYEVPIEFLNNLDQNHYFIEKYITKNNKEYVRIISHDENNTYKCNETSLEDSYIYLIRENETVKK